MRSQKWPRFKYFCEFLNIFLGRLGVWPLPRLQRGEQRAAIGPRHAGQVGCDWRTADHVTTILPSDWLVAGAPPARARHVGGRCQRLRPDVQGGSQAGRRGPGGIQICIQVYNYVYTITIPLIKYV